MTIVHVLHVAQPVIDETERIPSVCRLDASAAVMAADDDMTDTENLDRVLHN